MVRMLLDFGASHLIRHCDEHTLLAEAARKGHVEIVDLLIEYGADVNAVGKDGLTAMEWASNEGRVAIMEHLRLERKMVSLHFC